MPRNIVLLEMQNSISSCIVGAVFISDSIFNGSLYDRFPDTYRFMKFWPSYVWGFIYLSAGLTHLLSLYFGNRIIRKSILCAKCGLWVFLGFCVIRGDLYAAAGWLYYLFGVFAATCYLKLRKNPDEYYQNPTTHLPGIHPN